MALGLFAVVRVKTCLVSSYVQRKVRLFHA
jgi:hypothetical protein